MELLLVPLAIVGVVKLTDLLFDGNYRGAVKIILAAIVGGVAGYYGVEGFTVVTGLAAGLAGSGLVTVADRV